MKHRFIRTRKLRYGAVAALLTVLVITVSVLVNAVFGTLAERFAWYTSMNGRLSYDVSDTCYTILGDALEAHTGKNVEIIFCDLPENLNAEATQQLLYETAISLGERFSDRLTVKNYDIYTNPEPVRRFTQTVDPVTGEDVETTLKSTSVIITSGEYFRTYSLEEFFSFRDGETTTPWAYNGEKKLASGILHAIDPEEHIVCLTKNHGELLYDAELLYLLDDAGYAIRYIDLYKDEIPENCELIISYNPNSDIIADDALSAVSETEKLDAFLSVAGNSLWVLVGNGTPILPNTERYLESWGVEFCYDASGVYRQMMQDTSSSLTSDGYTIYGEAVREGGSAALLPANDRKTVFKNATAIKAANGFLSNGDGSYTKGARTLFGMYRGGENAVAWANGSPVASGDGSLLMSMTAQQNAGGASYVGVVTSVDFFSEDFLQSAVYGNTDAMMHTFAVAGRAHLPEGLVLKPFGSTDISTVTTAQMLVWTITLTGVPAAAVTVTAVAVLVKRRRS